MQDIIKIENSKNLIIKNVLYYKLLLILIIKLKEGP